MRYKIMGKTKYFYVDLSSYSMSYFGLKFLFGISKFKIQDLIHHSTDYISGPLGSRN